MQNHYSLLAYVAHHITTLINESTPIPASGEIPQTDGAITPPSIATSDTNDGQVLQDKAAKATIKSVGITPSLFNKFVILLKQEAMKKILLTITALIYLTVSSGATVNLHFCMGKLTSWDLSAKADGNCGTCGMKKQGHKGCCNDEQKILKVDKDQKIAESSFQFISISSVAIVTAYDILPLACISSSVINNTFANGTPLKSSLAIFLLNRNFRI